MSDFRSAVSFPETNAKFGEFILNSAQPYESTNSANMYVRLQDMSSLIACTIMYCYLQLYFLG